ncbi:MAG: hypothetical protein KAG34_06085 [Cocleimonas sp.]|nr:hypothetical protein [Cocleimonas sp.]
MVSKTTKKIINLTFFQIIFLIATSLMVVTTAEATRINPNYSPIRVDIIDDRGRVFRQITTGNKAHNVKRAYVQAKRGKRYSLRLRNMSNRRVGVIIAVDGRNILTGKKSWLGKHEKMYILNPYETATYKGWRTAKNRVNRFFFTSTANSYATAWQDKSAMGVIALAVYDEKPRVMYRENQSNSFNSKRARPAPSAQAAQADEAGTGFGREEYSPTVKVAFKARHQATVKHFYKYEWRSTLCKRGVIQCYDRPREPQNRFWPKESYAPYPPGMNRNDYRNKHYNNRHQNQHDHNPMFDY